MSAGHPTSFRLSPEAERMLEELGDDSGLKRSAVVEQLIRERYRRMVRERGRETAGKKSRNGT